MLDTKLICHVHIEAPDGSRDFRKFGSLQQVREELESWPTGTIVEIELPEFQQELYLRKGEFGALV